MRHGHGEDEIILFICLVIGAFIFLFVKKKWLDLKGRINKAKLDSSFIESTNLKTDEFLDFAREMFLKFKDDFQNENLESMKHYVSETVFQDYKGRIERRRDRGESIKFRGLCVTDIRLYDLKNRIGKKSAELTVCCDYTVEKITFKNNLFADTIEMPFREYLTFRDEKPWIITKVQD